ncbi:MAG: hypothetical protein N3D15_03310 [Syntrophorhabdaceae bacterium]|nr:hypothetical protein [Syntrophorhabdaceae bacterium]
MDRPVIYLDFSSLNTLAMGFGAVQRIKNEDSDNIKKIWKAFKNEKLKLVTSGRDMKMDIIMCLNNQGCCITDMLTPKEAIEEFERWDKSDKEQTKYWRRMIFYFEQIDFLPEIYEHEDHGHPLDDLISPLSDMYGSTEKPPHVISFNEGEIKDILRECIRIFEYVFPETKWHDLRHIDYSLNWKAMELALTNLNIDSVLSGERGERIRRLFGLLNRVIGLSKKSSRKLPLDKSHGEFIIDMVIKKYFQPLEKSCIKHILNCLSHKIEFFLTTDYWLIDKISRIKDFKPSLKNLDIITPSQLVEKIDVDKLS